MPKPSYGIILFTDCKCSSGKYRVVIMKKRCSFQYLDLIRGRYRNKYDLRKLITTMTHEERELVSSNNFDDLWDDLWTNTKEDYTFRKSKSKLKFYQHESDIKYILQNSPFSKNQKDTMWEIPKGKKSKSIESGLTCAIREFSEETGIDIDDCKFLLSNDNDPEILSLSTKDILENDDSQVRSLIKLEELYNGSDDLKYVYYYYIGYIPDVKLPEKISTEHCLREYTISEEASEVLAIDITNTRLYLRDSLIKLISTSLEFLKRTELVNNSSQDDEGQINDT